MQTVYFGWEPELEPEHISCVQTETDQSLHWTYNRTIPLIYFFPDMSGICQVQQNFPVKANKRSKGTLSRSYGFKVPCLAIQEKY